MCRDGDAVKGLPKISVRFTETSMGSIRLAYTTYGLYRSFIGTRTLSSRQTRELKTYGCLRTITVSYCITYFLSSYHINLNKSNNILFIVYLSSEYIPILMVI